MTGPKTMQEVEAMTTPESIAWWTFCQRDVDDLEVPLFLDYLRGVPIRRLQVPR